MHFKEVKTREIESGMMMGRGLGKRKRKVLVNEYRVSVWEE